MTAQPVYNLRLGLEDKTKYITQSIFWEIAPCKFVHVYLAQKKFCRQIKPQFY